MVWRIVSEVSAQVSDSETLPKTGPETRARLDFERLFDSCQNKLFNTVLRLVGSEDDALDIVQDAFLKAYRSLSGFKGESRFYTWIYRIAVNTALSFRRSAAVRLSRKSVSLDGDKPDGEPDARCEIADERYESSSAASSKELGNAIAREIAILEPELRAVVVLRDIEELSYDEISEILEIPRGTVKSRLHRGRLALRDRLEEFL